MIEQSFENNTPHNPWYTNLHGAHGARVFTRTKLAIRRVKNICIYALTKTINAVTIYEWHSIVHFYFVRFELHLSNL